MPKKPRYGRALQKKKKKMKQPAVSAPAASPVKSQENMPIVSTPPPSAPVKKTKAPAVKYPYVTAELRRIGVLAGATLAILVVLALVL